MLRRNDRSLLMENHVPVFSPAINMEVLFICKGCGKKGIGESANKKWHYSCRMNNKKKGYPQNKEYYRKRYLIRKAKLQAIRQTIINNKLKNEENCTE